MMLLIHYLLEGKTCEHFIKSFPTFSYNLKKRTLLKACFNINDFQAVEETQEEPWNKRDFRRQRVVAYFLVFVLETAAAPLKLLFCGRTLPFSETS